jgi:cation transporter-like permease
MKLIAKTTDEFINDLLPKLQDGSNIGEINTYNNLPDLSISEFIAAVVRTLLGWSMIITIVAIVVTGVFFLTAQGKDEQITKAKSIIVYLLIGLLVMSAAYGIVIGLSQFNFLEAA